MKLAFIRDVRLRPRILTMLVLLTVPVFSTIIIVSYLSNDRIARSTATELLERFRTDAVESIRNAFDPIKSLVRGAAVFGDQQPDFYSDNRSLKYLFSIQRTIYKVVSAYAGLPARSLRHARQTNHAL